jgi:hypothetical protein
MKRPLAAGLLALSLAVMPLAAAAQHDDTVSGDKATDMVVDVVVVRPLGLVATVVGTVLTLGRVNANFALATRPIRDAAREAGRAEVSFTASGSRQRNAPESARPSGLPRESASAALRRLARDGPCRCDAPCIHRFLGATQARN